MEMNPKETLVRAEEAGGWEIDPRSLIVKKVCARGGFSVVHKGFYLGNLVAVKVLDFGQGGMNDGVSESVKVAWLKKEFLQEVTLWNKLDHPNITKMIGATMDMSEYDLKSTTTDKARKRITPAANYSACCIVAEYVEGGTLRSYLRKKRFKKLPYNVVIQLALHIARGLSYLHSKKIVHRDVKTDNVLLGKDRMVKLTDFGVSEIESKDPLEMMTGEVGTYGYMAPEVQSGKPYGHKCDVYSFGICLWEIYCCEIPYSYLSSLENIPASIYKDMRPNIPRCCPRSLAKLMEWCWETDPKRRPEMEQVVRAFEEIDLSEGERMTPVDPPLGCFCFFSGH